ncbi:MAG: AsmA family protein, partial [Gammaproteobacteria bacterium]
MKALKLIGVLAILLVIIIAGGVAAFVALSDPNDFKEQIAARVLAETGRTLTLEGELEWAFWPKVKLKAGPLALNNAPGFGNEPFFAAQELQIAVATLPLLKNQIEMDTAKLYGVRINLAANADGITNWADLIGDTEDQKSSGDIAAIALGGVDIQDATITWRDVASGQNFDINKLNISTGALTFGDPIAFEMSLGAVANQPAIDSDVSLAGTVSYDLGDEKYHVEPLNLEMVIRSKNVPGGTATLKTSAIVDVDLDKGIVRISQLALSGLGTELSGDIEAIDIESEASGARGALAFKGNDLALIFNALELPVAEKISKLKQRGFNFTTEFDANMQSG